MKKILFVILLAIMQVNASNAQNGGTLYAELLGNGIAYSINYDFRFNAQQDNLGARVGLAYLGESFIAPIQLNYLFGSGNNRLELGAGLALYNEGGSDNNLNVAGSGAIMYRYQKTDGHFVFRAGLAPTFIKIDEDDFFSGLDVIYRFWPGISFGYRF